MCIATNFAQKIDPTRRVLGDKFKYADPLMYAATKRAGQWEDKLMPTPQVPAMPNMPQSAKMPTPPARRRNPALASPGSTMLTGTPNLGYGSLLGG